MITQPNPKTLLRGALPAADRGRLAEAHRLMQLSRMTEAEPLLRSVVQRHPASFDALHSLGLFALQLGRQTDGIELIRSALQSDPNQADALFNLGNALHRAGDLDPALACIHMALAIDPSDNAARLEGAAWLVASGRSDEASKLLGPMRQDGAASAQACYRAGRAALALGDQTEALSCFERAAAASPTDVQIFVHQGETLARLGRMSEAVGAFAKALELDDASSRAHYGRGHALLSLGEHAVALEAADKALRADPGLADAWNLRGAVQMGLQSFEAASESFRQALQVDPSHRVAVRNFADALRALRRYEDAALVYERLLALWPDCEFTKGKLMHCKMMSCDWLNYDLLLGEIERDIDAGVPAAEPIGMLAYCASPARLQRSARMFAAALHPERSSAPAPAPRSTRSKIRVGYVSGEFRQHATSVLFTRLLELHDSTRFEVFAFDNGRADRSAYRGRIEAAVAEVVAIADFGDQQAFDAVRAREIDILVDLDGYFGATRTDLFSRRPAPVQVNFLGFPGTLGAPWMDYIVADRIVIPPQSVCFYDEAVVYLPDSYLPSDDQRQPAEGSALRRDHGLPETGFVFCCFNDRSTITPTVFAMWMQLLVGVPGSVLWLLNTQDVEALPASLIAEAQWHGIDANRLVFAPVVDADTHLARLHLADLVLDTLPCGARATASDALWACVPMVTCLGDTFAGRVGASLLSAMGLPGLIAHSLADYEALAHRLATSPDELLAWRAELARRLSTAPLFDSQRFRRHLEAAYEAMFSRAQAGLPPVAIEIAACEPSFTPAWHPGARLHHEQTEAQTV